MACAHAEIAARADALKDQMEDLVIRHYPALLKVYGAATLVSAQLVVTAGGNPERIRSEAAFAAFCSVGLDRCARIVWKTDSEEWVSGEALRLDPGVAIFVELSDKRCRFTDTWLSPDDVWREGKATASAHSDQR